MVYQPQTASLQITTEVAFDATAGLDLGAAEPVATVSPVAANDAAVSSLDGAGAGFSPIDVYGESDPNAVTLPVAGPPVLVGPLFDNVPAPGVEEASSDTTAARPRGWLGRLVDKIVAPFAPQPQGAAPETIFDGDAATSPTEGTIDPAGDPDGVSEDLLTGADELVSGWQDQGVELIPELDLVCDGTEPEGGRSPVDTSPPHRDLSAGSANTNSRSRPADDEGPALSRLPVATEPAAPLTPAAIPYTYYYGPGQIEVASEPLITPVTVTTVGLEPGPVVGLAIDLTQDDGTPLATPSPVQGIASGTKAEQDAPVAKKSITPQTAVAEAVAAEDAPAPPESAEPPAAGENLLAGAEDPVDPHAGHHHGVFAGETTDTALQGAPVSLQDKAASGTFTSTGRAAVIQTRPMSMGDTASQPAVARMEPPPHIASTDRSIPSRDSLTLDPAQGHPGRDGDEQRDGDGQDDQTDIAGRPFLLGASAFLQPGGTPHGIAIGAQSIQPGFVFIPAGAVTGSAGTRANTAAATQRDQVEVGRGLAHVAATVAHKTDNPSGDRDRQGEHPEQAGIIAAFNAAGPMRRPQRSSLTRPNPQSSVPSSDVFVTGLG